MIRRSFEKGRRQNETSETEVIYQSLNQPSALHKRNENNNENDKSRTSVSNTKYTSQVIPDKSRLQSRNSLDNSVDNSAEYRKDRIFTTRVLNEDEWEEISSVRNKSPLRESNSKVKTMSSV